MELNFFDYKNMVYPKINVYFEHGLWNLKDKRSRVLYDRFLEDLKVFKDFNKNCSVLYYFENSTEIKETELSSLSAHLNHFSDSGIRETYFTAVIQVKVDNKKPWKGYNNKAWKN